MGNIFTGILTGIRSNYRNSFVKHNKNNGLQNIFLLMVPEAGLEPARF